MADVDKKPWTELQKFETLLYIFDTLNPAPEWKLLKNMPYGRNLNTVKKMIRRERVRIEKEKEKSGEATDKKNDDPSDTESKKTKPAPSKAAPAGQSGGDSSAKAKRKSKDQVGNPAPKRAKSGD